MNKEHDLFQHFAQEQMIYMWNVLTAIFFTQVLMVIGYCAALACFPDFWWTCTLCFGIPFAYIAIQNIYIDHDVMHGATFPVYEWQRFLTHPFADFCCVSGCASKWQTRVSTSTLTSRTSSQRERTLVVCGQLLKFLASYVYMYMKGIHIAYGMLVFFGTSSIIYLSISRGRCCVFGLLFGAHPGGYRVLQPECLGGREGEAELFYLGTAASADCVTQPCPSDPIKHRKRLIKQFRKHVLAGRTAWSCRLVGRVRVRWSRPFRLLLTRAPRRIDFRKLGTSWIRLPSRIRPRKRRRHKLAHRSMLHDSRSASTMLPADIPLMRGGGGSGGQRAQDARKAKNTKLMDALRSLLEEQHDDSEKWLIKQVRRLLDGPREGSLLDALKGLLTQVDGASFKSNVQDSNKGRWRSNHEPRHVGFSRWNKADESFAVFPRSQRRWHHRKVASQAHGDWQGPRSGTTQGWENAWAQVRWQVRVGDWHATSGTPLVVQDVQELSDKMDANKLGQWVLVAGSADEAIEALNIVRSDDAHELTVLLQGSKDEQPKGIEAPSISWVRCPGSLQGKISSRWVWQFRSSEDKAPQLRTRLTLDKKFKPEMDAQSYVLRCKASWRFLESWHSVRRAPARAFRTWAHRVIGESPGVIQDSWAWQEDSDGVFSGLIRVNALSAARSLVMKSGADHAGDTWFVDPVTKGIVHEDIRVLWQAWREDENWSEYMGRVRAASSQGLVLGKRQCGLRIKTSDDRWQEPCFQWRLSGVPRELGYDAVKSILEGMGFAEIDIKGQNHRGKGRLWFFKARREDKLEVVQTQLDLDGHPSFELQATRDIRMQHQRRNTWNLREERRVVYRAPEESRQSTVETAAIHHHSTVPMDVDRKTDARESASNPSHVGDKRPLKEDGDEHTSQQTASIARKAWAPKGSLVDNIGQGNCVFLSISEALNEAGDRNAGKTRTHRQVRAFVVHHMRTNKADWSTTWEGQGKHDTKGNPDQLSSFDDYLNAVEKQTAWAGALEVAAFAEAAQKRCWIYDDRGDCWCFHEQGRGPPIFLYYSGNHYQFLKDACEDEFVARKAQMAAEGRKQNTVSRPMRGGGLTDFASSTASHCSFRKGACLTDFATQVGRGSRASDTSAVSGPLKRIATKDTVSHRAGRVSKCHRLSAAFLSTLGKDGRDGASADPSVRTWECDVCGVVLQGELAKLKNHRNNHIQRVHEGVPRHKFSKLCDTVYERIEASFDFGEGVNEWKCGFCKKGLPALPKYQRRVCINRHLDKHHPGRSLEEANAKLFSTMGVKQAGRRSSFALTRMIRTLRQSNDVIKKAKSVGHDIHKLVSEVASKAPTKRSLGGLSCRRCTHIWLMHDLRDSVEAGRKCGGRKGREKALRHKARVRLWKGCTKKERDLLSSVWRLSQLERDTLKQLSTKTSKKGSLTRSATRRQHASSASWQRSLPEDGDIEEQPGPSRSPDTLRCVTLNTGGINAAFWSLRAASQGKYDIFVIQESHLWGRSLTSWHQKALKLGFRSWALPAEVTNNAVGARQVHGGLAVLVKSTLKASLVQQVRDDNGEMQALAIGDRLFLNLWHRPRKAHIGMCETIAALTEQFPLFLAMGDWNVLPNQCPVKSLENVQVVAAVDSSGLLPTRWESTRCIDYAAFRGGQCTEAAILEDKVSDHKAVAFTFDGFGNPHSSEHFLKPKMLYKCPTSLDMDGWKKALKSAYFPFHRGSVDFTNQAQVDECWWRFNRHVEGVFQQVARDHNPDPMRTKRCQPKGWPMQATTERDFGVKREDSGGFLLRRLRKCLGRVAERNRRNSGPDAERLDAKIKQTWPSILPWTDSWSQQEVVMQQAVDDLQQSTTASRLSQWRDRIKRGGREAHRWLRCETGSLPASLHDDGPSSKCPSESLAILSSYWRRVWDRSDGPSEDEIFDRHHASMVDLLIQGEFGWDPEEFHYALQQWAGPWGSNWYKYLLTVPFIPVIHFFGLNDTGSLFALEWWMHFPDEGAGGKCNKEFLDR